MDISLLLTDLIPLTQLIEDHARLCRVTTDEQDPNQFADDLIRDRMATYDTLASREKLMLTLYDQFVLEGFDADLDERVRIEHSFRCYPCQPLLSDRKPLDYQLMYSVLNLHIPAKKGFSMEELLVRAQDLDDKSANTFLYGLRQHFTQALAYFRKHREKLESAVVDLSGDEANELRGLKCEVYHKMTQGLLMYHTMVKLI